MSYKVKIDGKTIELEKKTVLLDLINDPNKEIVCASVNNRIRELTYEIYYDADIQFLTVKDQDAIRTYETSLRYLLAMAIERRYPGLKTRFGYNVSRSIFVQILEEGKKVDTAFVKAIQQEMDALVKADLPFKRMIVSNDVAMNIYKERGFEDKLEILKYRPEKTVHLYDCDGYLNYMYGRMVPSTGYLKKWNIRLYSPGLLVQYPRSECKGEIPPFEDAPTFGKTLKQSHVWAKTAGTDSVAGINQNIETLGPTVFINLCEARQNQMLCELGDRISGDIEDIRLICIAGPSSSGKTTFANRLRIELLSRGLHPIRISLDDYYLPRDKAPKDENGEPDLEDINALDVPLFNQQIVELINGDEVQLPKFDFKQGKRVKGRLLKIDTNEPIIIEGIHALNDLLTSSVPKHQKFKIFIAPQAQVGLDNQNPLSLTDLRLLRRIVRDKKFRNASAEETIGMWPSVRKGEFKWIYKTQEGTDYVYNSFLSYELCVMKKHALPLLLSIEKDSQYYPVAERLIRMLKFFVDLDEEWIPCNSLLREFIGGSCYEDV